MNKSVLSFKYTIVCMYENGVVLLNDRWAQLMFRLWGTIFNSNCWLFRCLTVRGLTIFFFFLMGMTYGRRGRASSFDKLSLQGQVKLDNITIKCCCFIFFLTNSNRKLKIFLFLFCINSQLLSISNGTIAIDNITLDGLDWMADRFLSRLNRNCSYMLGTDRNRWQSVNVVIVVVSGLVNPFLILCCDPQEILFCDIPCDRLTANFLKTLRS